MFRFPKSDFTIILWLITFEPRNETKAISLQKMIMFCMVALRAQWHGGILIIHYRQQFCLIRQLIDHSFGLRLLVYFVDSLLQNFTDIILKFEYVLAFLGNGNLHQYSSGKNALLSIELQTYYKFQTTTRLHQFVSSFEGGNNVRCTALSQLVPR